MKHFNLNVLLPALVFFAFAAKSQTCTASFSYSLMPNGNVVFTSNSVPVTSLTTYWWSFGNNTTYSAIGTPTAAAGYTANGVYTVTLFFVTQPTCSNVAVQTITITNSTSSCNLNANFNYIGLGTGNVNFTNFSSGTTSGTTYTWNFGDSNTSNVTSPSHQYASAGMYVVTLTASNNSTPTCVDVQTMAVSVCTVGFTYTVGANGMVNFQGNAAPTNSTTYYYWYFGNSQFAQGNTATAPSATYAAAGIYSVTFGIASSVPMCSVNITQTIQVVTSNTCNLAANFSYQQGSNGQVNFSNLSTGTNSTTTYSWNFGNSNTSTNTSPSTAYAANGQYVVTLTASNGGTCTSTITKTVTVNSICNLNASFTHTIGANGNVLFSSTATGTIPGTSYFWNFGDNQNGFGKNTSHTYANGTYMVTHIVTNNSVVPTCSAVAYDTITVSNNTCIANAGFSVIPTSTPQYWNAWPVSPSNVANAIWYWGDGSSSNGLYTSHQYSAAGQYSICLSVTLTCGATDMACTSYSIFRSSSSVVYINVINPTTVGLDENNGLTKFEVYPNPADQQLLIKNNLASGTDVDVTLYNITGAKVYNKLTRDSGQKEVRIDTGHLPAGIYILHVNAEGMKPVTQRVVIER